MKFQREFLASWNINEVEGYSNETAGGKLPGPYTASSQAFSVNAVR